ncbi:ATP-binding protein [Geothrix sp. PMB-07]|uniref:hybrid sensor histidine kinase/response regulator n=1 Tax=Geothrix sp. PMB-07 TaxID=3068640 RepID=UPI0027407C66|nr:ATP-binding protein [Geothrix sp. PMB-07]WLT32563.1 ATP-binding protein [Geothrix sp. PMB-07]
MPDYLICVAGLQPFRLSRDSACCRIGRTPDQDLILEDPAVSRSHAQILWREDRLTFEDLDSRHGSFINGKRVHSAQTVTPRDAIRLGGIEIRIEEVPAEPLSGEEITQSLPIGDLQGWRQGDEVIPMAQAALDLFYEFSLLLLREPTTTKLLEDMLERLFQFLGAGQGAILLPDEVGQLIPLASHSLRPDDTSPLRWAPKTVRSALDRREAMLLRESEATASPASRVATSSAMAVPLEHAGEVLGLFYFDAGRSRPPFTENELRLVASLGNLAAARVLQQRLSEELRRKDTLEQELKAVEAATQAKSDFLAHMSHEMRTPMNAIQGFLHLALKESLPPTAEDYLRRVEQSGQALLALLDDVLDLSKIEAGRVDLECIPFRIPDVLQQVVDLFSHTAAAKGLTLTARGAEAAEKVLLGDPTRLRQVLINLVGNALKFTEEGKVGIEVDPLPAPAGEAAFRFSVRDTGIGLSADQAARLFTPFTQAEASTTRHFGGTGLGLAISKQLAELMGGRIWVESGPGLGSLFQFTLTFPEAADQILPTSSAPASRRDRAHLTGLRALVVEDNPISRELSVILLREAGLQVEVASHGAEAVTLARATAFDVILMDLEMPGMDGFEATRTIRSRGRNRGTPIIAVTAHALATHQDRCLASGMDDCLTKPIAPGLLLETLAKWISRGPLPAAEYPAAVSEGGSSAGDGLEVMAEVVDLPRALDRIGGRRDPLRTFLKAFAKDSASAKTIGEAVARGDHAAALSEAHALRGAAATLDLIHILEAAKELEACLRQEPLGDWESCCERLDQALANFREAAARMP